MATEIVTRKSSAAAAVKEREKKGENFRLWSGTNFYTRDWNTTTTTTGGLLVIPSTSARK